MHGRTKVTIQQDLWDFGNDFMDVEADECTVTKYHSGDRENPVAWVAYVGLVKRGDPRSLKLIRMPIRKTKARAPGPGPITLNIWRPLAKKYLAGRSLILHTDSARAYQEPIPGVQHTSVVHQLKKIKGKWVQPKFVETVKFIKPDGQKLIVKSGAQTIDGFWSHLKRQVTRCHSRTPDTIDQYVRFAQFMYWSQGRDPMEMLKESMPMELA